MHVRRFAPVAALCLSLVVGWSSLVGCGSESDACETDDNCFSGQVCRASRCVAGASDGGPLRDGGVASDAGRGPIDAAFAQIDAYSTEMPDAFVPIVDEAGMPACQSGVSAPFDTHRTNEEFTDPPSCTNCPSAFAALDELEVGAVASGTTTLRIQGSSATATSCEWYVLGGNCGVTRGDLATDPDGAGLFDVVVPLFCGENVVQMVCRNGAGSRVFVRRVTAPGCESRDVRITLAWDDQGRDLELHLIRPGGQINNRESDCTWTTCMSPTGLEWGDPSSTADNPRKDVDNTGNFGPENIYLESASPGVYHVMVEHWGSGTPSAATLQVAVREATIAEVSISGLVSHHVWDVGTLSLPAGTFTPNGSTIDCSGSWSGGCTMAIP